MHARSLIALLGLLPMAPGPSRALADERPVVVELFTSEGCSSCPPADAYLTDLSRSRRDVLPLAFHVTYWNGLGWRDPFSLDAATARQARYGARFGDGSYTPEMVVDGTAGLVGSDRDKAASAIASALAARGAGVPVTMRRGAASMTVRVGPGEGTGRILLIGFDPMHETAVGRGENRGRTLTESNIVRSIRDLGAWEGAAVSFDEVPGAGLEAAVLVQASDGRILGAARAARER